MPTLPSPWLLIIDDEPEMAEELVELCGNAGFPAVSADNLEPALALLEKHHTIGVIASDLRMPGQESGALMSKLASSAKNLGRPCTLIIMTGHAGSTERKHATLLGVEHFFSKPIDTEAFLTTLGGIARDPRGRTQAAD